MNMNREKESDKELLKRKNTICFIEAAKELIDENGIGKLSIRKIAERAGFHNSTIYLYFQDVEQLILLASLKHFNEYSKALAAQSLKKSAPLDTFLSIWRAFSDSVFAKPEIFYNFFFGKHSNNLTEIIEQYYDLFPEEKAQYSEEIKDMYYGKNIYERCYAIMSPLLHEDTRLTQDNISLVNDIIVSYLKYLLEDQCKESNKDVSESSEKLLSAISYLIGI